MKMIIISIIMLTASLVSSSQQTVPSAVLTKQDYLKKSRTQNTTAWFLLSGGFVLLSVSSGISAKEIGTDISNIFSGEVRKSTNTVEILGYTGLASMLGSIPLFIAAHKNKMKAMSLSLKNETVPQLQKGGFVNQSVPSLTLQIKL